ncbi:hypothetical protein MKX03_004800 [Papaver bracteatum]|nr:hypothetical protein MKX03_004800 [Papaver bracteatum]
MCLEDLVRCVTGSSSDGLGISRTGYHFQPPKNWINDPNGPMYYNGIYHLFYQYNPNGAEWGDIVWAHSVSKDMVNWFHVDIALHPTDPFDITGCWSGSTTILPGKGPVIFYTGGDAEKRQLQNIAVPKDLSDPLLVEWKKLDQNPVLSTPDGIEPDKFRDPSTGWLGEDGYWRVIIGSEKSRLGMALLFKSKDFLTWTQSENAFHSASTASTKNNGMWECVDFFPVALKGEAALDTSARGDDIKYVFKIMANSMHLRHSSMRRKTEGYCGHGSMSLIPMQMPLQEDGLVFSQYRGHCGWIKMKNNSYNGQLRNSQP